MEPRFFPNPSDFRAWLEKYHESETELLVGFYKVNSGKDSMSWPQSVDEALCFGWIDGIRKSIDKDSYTIRFTPRKPTSIWSAVNIRKMEELAKKGLIKPAGAAIFEKRTESRSKIYAFENQGVELSPEFEAQFKANKKAWEFFNAQAPSYRKTAVHIVMTAKQEKTRRSRLEMLVSDSEAGRKLKRLSY